jgi:NAD(P)-dependent dehydrogenase (short-subunit alcohol dehydrogenase family)
LLEAVTPDSKLFLVARNLEKAHEAKQRVHAYCGSRSLNDNIIPMACENTSLNSVRDFCSALRKELFLHSKDNNGGGIDVLCLNAAVLLGEDAETSFTEDDIEITFQTNHLAPFLMANLLYDLINPGGRVVVTSSGLHTYCSFEDFKGCTMGDKARRRFEMVNRQKFNHKQSYATSKLCNVAFCFALNRRLKEKNAKAVCFTPGLIPSSGLFRHQKNWVKTVWKKDVVGMDDSEEWGGCVLAWMALSDRAIIEDPDQDGIYWRAPLGISKRGGKVPEDLFLAPVNEDAIKPKNQELLWTISAELAGVLSNEEILKSKENRRIDIDQ